jgi:hypothetical protein
VTENSAVAASAKLVVLKLKVPLTQIPELTNEMGKFETVVRIPESVFIIRTTLTVDELCDRLSAIIGDRGSVLAGGLCAPCKTSGGDVALTQVLELIERN